MSLQISIFGNSSHVKFLQKLTVRDLSHSGLRRLESMKNANGVGYNASWFNDLGHLWTLLELKIWTLLELK